MIEVFYRLGDFQGRDVDGNALVFECSAAGGLPPLFGVATRGDEVMFGFNATLPLTPSQRTTLDGVVALHDASHAYLEQQQSAMNFLIDEYAKTLLASSGTAQRSWLAKAFSSGPSQADADVAVERDTAKTAVDAAPTPDAAVRIAERYLGRVLL